MPLRAVMGPPADVPPARGSSVAQSKPPKGNGSKEPATLDQVRAKTIHGLITEKSKKNPKVPVPETALPASEALVEAFGLPSPMAQDPITIVIPDRVSPSLGKSPTSSKIPPSTLPVSESASGSKGPWVPTPYSLPSGITITEEIFSKVK
ncbi:hypothetical protein LIER_33903 [Lithospermum erythrorhizon]|uniref:Uncharacterized protein n=1 Tax=Lithospermum erythrorhizon TaxID=34254 RepID=A0AAV3S163_LITER